MMTEYEKGKVQAVKDELGKIIKDLAVARSVALAFPSIAKEYDGKCWNSRIEKDLQARTKVEKEVYMFTGRNNDGRFVVSILLYSGVELPYTMNTVYRAEKDDLYTKAGNFRIDSQDWQEWANKYAKRCDDYIVKFKADIEKIDCLISEYDALLEKSEQIANSVQVETRTTIKRAGIFREPIIRLFK